MNVNEHKKTVVIDVSSIHTPRELHKALKNSLNFPDMYGMNWDAFWDAITGLVELPDIIIFSGWDNLVRNLPEDAKMMRSSLEENNSRYRMNYCEVRYMASLPASLTNKYEEKDMMIDSKLFDNLLAIVPKWNWDELNYGLQRGIISAKVIIDYAVDILDSDTPQFDTVAQLAMANERDKTTVRNILQCLSTGDKETHAIAMKWVFVIIKYNYFHNRENILDVIEEVYAEFDCPKEIQNIVRYMPLNEEDAESLKVKIENYIKNGEKMYGCEERDKLCL